MAILREKGIHLGFFGALDKAAQYGNSTARAISTMRGSRSALITDRFLRAGSKFFILIGPPRGPGGCGEGFAWIEPQ